MCNIGTNCHPRSPDYNPGRPHHYCSICKEGIFVLDEYIENENGDTAHWDCFHSMRELLKWLGYGIKTFDELMEN